MADVFQKLKRLQLFVLDLNGNTQLVDQTTQAGCDVIVGNIFGSNLIFINEENTKFCGDDFYCVYWLIDGCSIIG